VLSMAVIGKAEADATPNHDHRCRPDQVCKGIESANETDCKDVGKVCFANETAAKFSRCVPETIFFCETNRVRYGAVECPGICKGTTAIPCTIIVIGCNLPREE